MSRASVVYVLSGALLLKRPGDVVFHRPGRSVWPQYHAPDGGRFSTHISGREAHWTACGRPMYENLHSAGEPVLIGEHEARRWRWMDGVRRDVAERIGRPCRSCWPDVL